MFLIALKTKYGNNDDSPWRGQVSTDPTIFDFGDEPITSINVSIRYVLIRKNYLFIPIFETLF